jgi:hypothetical protein
LTTAAGNRSEGFYNVDGSLQLDKIKAISRTYVQAAQGTILSQKFFQNGTFTASIRYDPTSTQDTQIYVNNKGKGVMWYPNGVNVTVSSDYPDLQDKFTTITDDSKIIIREKSTHFGVLNIIINPK